MWERRQPQSINLMCHVHQLTRQPIANVIVLISGFVAYTVVLLLGACHTNCGGSAVAGY